MINCESGEKIGHRTTSTTSAQKPSKNELKTRILNSILSRFSNNSSPTTTTATTTSASVKKSGGEQNNSLQKFSDKRIADLINNNSNNSKTTTKPILNFNPTTTMTTNYSINEARLRDITHTPYPNQQMFPYNYNSSPFQPLIKPVALRPKKLDSNNYESSSSSSSSTTTTTATNNLISHSFRLSAQEQQWTYELNSNTQRNSRFINRRSTIARSEYSESTAAPTLTPTPITTNNVPTISNSNTPTIKPLLSSQSTVQSDTTAYSSKHHYQPSMMMRPRLNLIKMKIHNLIENKPASFGMIEELKENLKESQLQQQKKFQIPNQTNVTNKNNTALKLDMLLANMNKASSNNNNNNNNNSNCTPNNTNTNNGSLISLTSSTSSLLSSSSTSSLTSAVYSGGEDDNSLSFDKFGPNEPKIDLDLIENDDL